jgi:anti-sigma factor RsiW
MTHPSFTCDDFDAALPDWLEGTLPPEPRVTAEAHRAGCARCAALVADLDRLMTDARALPELAPSHDLWPDIAERIAPRVLELPPSAAPVAPRGAMPAVAPAWRRWAAAAALVTVSVGATYVAMRPRGGSRSGGATLAEVPGQPPAPRPIAVSRPPATETLAGEVQALEQALARRESELDPKTATVIRQSLSIIDRAIADARAALAADPSNVLLDQQLTRVLGKKVELMRRAAMLPART